MPDMTNLIGVTDARVWAREWLKVVGDRPELATDEPTVFGWFANAIQAGHDALSINPDAGRINSLLTRLVGLRSLLRQGDPLPDWAPEQWIGVLSIKLGQAALGLMGPDGEGVESPEGLKAACEQLLALAAAALDAVEAIEGSA